MGTQQERSRAYYLRNKEKVCERAKVWKRAHAEYNCAKSRKWRSEHPEKSKAFCNAYNAEHRENRRLYAIAYRAANKEKCKKQYRDYYKNNKERRIADVMAYQKRRPDLAKRKRVKRRNASGHDYTTERMVKAWWQMYGGKCWMCGQPATHTDHVKPLAKGGGHWPCNLRPACKRCNLWKHGRWYGVENIQFFIRRNPIVIGAASENGSEVWRQLLGNKEA